MIRKITLSAIVLIAMTLGGFAPTASAQTPTPEVTPTPPHCDTVGYNNCVAYPEGGLGGSRPATETPTPRPQATATAVAATGATTTDVTDGSASIAFTGSESRVLGYVGAGMIGFGAVALAAARRRSDSNEN